MVKKSTLRSMNNKKVEEKLGCRLTSKIEFRLDDNKILRLILSPECLVSNMQYYEGAFDSYALCLKANYPEHVNKVVIEWEKLNDDDLQKLSESKNKSVKILKRHYNRFLYRAYKFKENFPRWVELSSSIPESFMQDYNKGGIGTELSENQSFRSCKKSRVGSSAGT